MQHHFIFPRFGNCNVTISYCNLGIYLFTIANSLIFASATDTLTLHGPKLMFGLVWLDVQFNGLFLDIFLSLQIWTSFNWLIYICCSKYMQSCFCSVCKLRYLKFSNSSWLILKVFFSTSMTLSSKFIVPPQKKLSTWQWINPWNLSSLCQLNTEASNLFFTVPNFFKTSLTLRYQTLEASQSS